MDGNGATTGWVPTHRSPGVALPAFDAPGANRAAVATAEPGLDLRVVTRQDDWAQVEFANGWTGWVDGRALVPITRTIPPGGLSAWDAPDPSSEPTTSVAAGLEVSVLESSEGWAHVAFANGWTAWVDGRALTNLAPRRISPLPAIGASLVVLGSFLPWVKVGRDSASSWDIPLSVLVTHHSSTNAFKTGIVLLVSLVACAPYVTQRPLHPYATVALGCVGIYTAMAGMVLVASLNGPQPGTGIWLAYLGGLVIVGDFRDGRRRR